MDFTLNDSTQSCILRLQAILDYLKPAERRIAEYILKHPQEVLSLTINELSAHSGASYATVNRLVNHAGLSGFKELKKCLYQDILNNNSFDFLDVISFSQGTATAEICQNIFSLSQKVLAETTNIVNISSIDEAASRILSTNMLCIVGTGLSGICARYAYSRFFRIGIPCYSDSDTTHFKMKASLLEKGDLLFAISSSGRSSAILDCARIASENGADVISLSDYAISPLSKLSSISLFTTARNANMFMNIDMPLLIGQIVLIDALYMCCCVKMGKRSSELYVKTKKSADAEKLK